MSTPALASLAQGCGKEYLINCLFACIALCVKKPSPYIPLPLVKTVSFVTESSRSGHALQEPCVIPQDLDVDDALSEIVGICLGIDCIGD